MRYDHTASRDCVVSALIRLYVYIYAGAMVPTSGYAGGPFKEIEIETKQNRPSTETISQSKNAVTHRC